LHFIIIISLYWFVNHRYFGCFFLNQRR
jgi:hypothetical protein